MKPTYHCPVCGSTGRMLRKYKTSTGTRMMECRDCGHFGAQEQQFRDRTVVRFRDL